MPSTPHELDQIQQDITSEIQDDGPKLAKELFGDKGKMPDMGNSTTAEALAMYRDAFLRQDRNWLIQEARRDPVQFLDLTKKLGVVTPPEALQ